MGPFRILLAAMFVVLSAYTAIVTYNHGFGLLEVFFGSIAAMAWPGQFNVDFTCFLTLAALWLAWRHQFTPRGLALGVLGFFGGALFLSAYLLIASCGSGGDVRVLLLGKARA